MGTIHDQLRKRRKALGIKQDEMQMRVGMARQQYQRLESNGNPRLDNLELVAKGLKMELMLIPQEKLQAVKAIIDGRVSMESMSFSTGKDQPEASDYDADPWNDVIAKDD